MVARLRRSPPTRLAALTAALLLPALALAQGKGKVELTWYGHAAFGVKTPTSWTSETRSIPSILIFIPGRIAPSLTRTRQVTPR